jgi:hypothetical protein
MNGHRLRYPGRRPSRLAASPLAPQGDGPLFVPAAGIKPHGSPGLNGSSLPGGTLVSEALRIMAIVT